MGKENQAKEQYKKKWHKMHVYKAYRLFANDFCMMTSYLLYLTQYFGSFPFKISLAS